MDCGFVDTKTVTVTRALLNHPNGERAAHLTSEFEPSYRKLFRSGELERRVEDASRRMEKCDLCAWHCRINRLVTIKGAICRTGAQAVVHSFGAHHGEEDPLRGRRGSGTIFFSWCNLRCVFCQNWEISQKGVGKPVTANDMAAMMLDIQERGCHNINLVSPSHVVAQILAAVQIAAAEGLRLPLIYNTAGYDSLEALALLDGVIDIYMPDMKYGDSSVARKYSKAKNYVDVNHAAVREMHHQVGDLILGPNGIAQRGLLIRHLVLPENLAASEKVLDFIAREVSRNTYLNLMDQYRPNYRAYKHPPLHRPLTVEEYRRAVQLARKFELYRLDRRSM